ncbi:unnamed protein product [Fraxinus pennsylvanica]|uniref:Uncharacterized protein n=1 Tax=Fraxinus pennsylvanica TaxID=56036 RepID=A0AAD1ZAE4_9LAMI|nr:unnamed protein product [Fraxinus pennsylvanica]
MYSRKKNVRQDEKHHALRQTGYPAVHQDLDLKLQGVLGQKRHPAASPNLSTIEFVNWKTSRPKFPSISSQKFPSISSQKFSPLFATPNDSRIPDEKKNLLISYLLVLTMFVDDFKSDPSDIAEDLRMTPVALRTHYENLGCKFRL